MKTIKIVKPLQDYNMRRPTFYRVLSTQQKLNLCHLVETLGLTFAQVAKRYKVNVGTVRYTFQKYTSNGNSVVSGRPRCGRQITEKSRVISDLVSQ